MPRLARFRHLNRNWGRIVPESLRLGRRYWRLGRELSPYLLGRCDRLALMRLCAAVPWADRQPAGSSRPATFRLADGARVCIGTRTELLAMREIFALDEYAIDLPFEPAVVLDCGANVGFASLYFASRYPGARIYAIEADPATFPRLDRNTREIANVVTVARALADGASTEISRSSDDRRLSEELTLAGDEKNGTAPSCAVPIHLTPVPSWECFY